MLKRQSFAVGDKIVPRNVAVFHYLFFRAAKFMKLELISHQYVLFDLLKACMVSVVGLFSPSLAD